MLYDEISRICKLCQEKCKTCITSRRLGSVFNSKAKFIIKIIGIIGKRILNGITECLKSGTSF